MTQQKTELTTARGIAVFPQLNEPSTKFDSNGVYECRLRYAADDAFIDTFRERAQKVIDAKFNEVVKQLNDEGKAGVAAKVTKLPAPVAVEEDQATGDETGFVTIKAKKTASGISKKTGKPWKSKPDIFDARGNKLTNAPAIGGGSEMKMNVELFGYYNAKDKQVGCSVRLNGVQVIKLVQYGARDAGGYGFGAEEDGDDLSGMEQDFADNSIADADDDDI
jgi:hypothetical protein